jgi:gluconate 5-dehydrogenase
MSESRHGKGGIGAFDLGGKVAVVTGASRGLGRHRVGAGGGWSKNDPRLAAGGSPRGRSRGDQVRRRRTHAASIDITDSDQCRALVGDAKRHWERIDILVCNAATNVLGMAETMPDDQWKRVIDTELSGYYYLARAVHPVMAAQRSGSIIMISANSSLVGYAGLVGVAVAKGGVDMMARNLAVEWGRDGIRINTINPGWTEHVPEDGADVAAGEGDLEEDIRVMTPLARRGRVEEFVYPAIFLASDASSYVTGHNLVVDGGYSIK